MRKINWWLIAFWVGIAIIIGGAVTGQLWLGIVGVLLAIVAYYKLPDKIG